MKMINISHKNWLLPVLGILLLTIVSITYISWKKRDHEYIFATEIVKKGSLSNTITATGTLEATNTVVVGTQVSGVIEKLYVDFNTVVEKGQLIAELDKSTLQSSLETAQADLDKAQAEYDYQNSNYLRMKVLFDKDLLAQSDYELVIYNLKKSKASVKSAKANLDRSARNLSYATIYSPIDGIVLNRAVEEGQTVAASMNTPELFTITNDLKEMQVEANIDEADIGMVKEKQRVEFTVDAFPDLNFEGEVSEIRLQPNESSNVITYIVIITVSNPDLKLKPGMTASITTYVEEANDVLLITGKATRFSPNQQLMHDYMSGLSENKEKSDLNESNTRNDESRPKPPRRDMEELDDSHKRIWVKDGDQMRPLIIEVGIDDGSNIEVISGLEEGNVLVTSFELADGSEAAVASHKDEEQKSPFVQERPKRKGGQGGGPR
ncbi:efflux RND transporter periplasmic adaptor subunit [Labilibaculum sp. DW002]|uniref:Efflux RND transporter periplasmic adaptor subunit n=1 Tax=Paralabilibaculum antarcticum TaxID=2912572 RepID=A0ABT5VWH3_9BACT|nr:efflux RND transporter periplasmic adaptor subunit [Labilibaculum sp. DW002]MDE5419642.1 efflux RND transporter periplasmic adaptor subunit [Labilibaculum sp. DW002]